MLGLESGYVVSGHTVDHLVGRLLTLIETLGLRDSQEKAIKDLARQEIWKPFNDQFASTFIDGSLHTVINKAVYDLQHGQHPMNMANTVPLPPTPRTLKYELVISD